ncbi:hypothetical protein ODJ79_38295 [Actinoplanes sp. KI2]|uniref:HAAS signaling domain-containing protein n=1 Tax=Actinoplanes sp. KI2 TaxID=2983315 RepID=UPI0021D58AD2|nr:hypothetical protein [Actinoplanes sp. KI2]MCU7729603.1 hypothetical protein [Actinoplanes sp. KI2]
MNDEITRYVEGVRHSLAGLAEATRDELIEDLPEHLAEVQAEGTGTLVDRLGPPEAYASELRGTAGLVGGFPDPPPAAFARLHEARDQAQRLLDRADRKIGPIIGYERARDFLVLLRPGWWVLRGYLIAMAVAYLLSGHTRLGLLPRLGDNELVALVLLAGCVLVSIVLGKRSPSFARLPRLALHAGTVVLVIFAFSGFVNADDLAREPGYSDVNYGFSDPNPYSNVNDVYVYDGQGRLVLNAHLYDQDGNPIQLGTNQCDDLTTGESSRSRNMGYPYCPQDAPFGSPSPSPSVSFKPTPSGSAAR